MKNKNKYFFNYKYYYNNLIVYNEDCKIEKILINFSNSKLDNDRIVYKENKYIRKSVTKALNKNVKFDNLLILEKGTDFQRKVWRAIYNTPTGSTITYKGIGKIISNKGYRAIGQACKNNPFPVLIPCHRVVSKNGIGGFAYSTEIKKKLLNFEGVDIESISCN